jgi:hypothetical protein
MEPVEILEPRAGNRSVAPNCRKGKTGGTLLIEATRTPGNLGPPWRRRVEPRCEDGGVEVFGEEQRSPLHSADDLHEVAHAGARGRRVRENRRGTNRIPLATDGAGGSLAEEE